MAGTHGHRVDLRKLVHFSRQAWFWRCQQSWAQCPRKHQMRSSCQHWWKALEHLRRILHASKHLANLYSSKVMGRSFRIDEVTQTIINDRLGLHLLLLAISLQMCCLDAAGPIQTGSSQFSQLQDGLMKACFSDWGQLGERGGPSGHASSNQSASGHRVGNTDRPLSSFISFWRQGPMQTCSFRVQNSFWDSESQRQAPLYCSVSFWREGIVQTCSSQFIKLWCSGKAIQHAPLSQSSQLLRHGLMETCFLHQPASCERGGQVRTCLSSSDSKPVRPWRLRFSSPASESVGAMQTSSLSYHSGPWRMLQTSFHTGSQLLRHWGPRGHVRSAQSASETVRTIQKFSVQVKSGSGKQWGPCVGTRLLSVQSAADLGGGDVESSHQVNHLPSQWAHADMFLWFSQLLWHSGEFRLTPLRVLSAWDLGGATWSSGLGSVSFIGEKLKQITVSKASGLAHTWLLG